MIRYDTNVKPTLIPTSLPGRPSKMPPETVIVIRNPNQARNPTTSPPATLPGSAHVGQASIFEEDREDEGRDETPDEPGSESFRSLLPHGFHVRLRLAQYGHPRLPERGPGVPNPAEDEAEDGGHNHGDVEVCVEECHELPPPAGGPL